VQFDYLNVMSHKKVTSKRNDDSLLHGSLLHDSLLHDSLLHDSLLHDSLLHNSFYTIVCYTIVCYTIVLLHDGLMPSCVIVWKSFAAEMIYDKSIQLLYEILFWSNVCMYVCMYVCILHL